MLLDSSNTSCSYRRSKKYCGTTICLHIYRQSALATWAPSGSCSKSSRWEFLESGNSSPTCCAYSKREIRCVAGGNRPGNASLLIESKASLKRPHSIMLPTLLKSVTIAWRNCRTMVKWKSIWKGGRNTALKQTEEQKREREGRRVMEMSSEWASKVPEGHFWPSFIGK